MKPSNLLPFLSLILLMICCKQSAGDLDQWKQEIMTVEKAFNDMAQEEGLAKAFEHFAASDGVIKRRKQIIQGKAAIRKWYEADVRPNETLTWQPSFVDVSSSGDLAYTYGNYTFTYPDSLGIIKTSNGIFHTVWKRQSDGTWRFVWD